MNDRRTVTLKPSRYGTMSTVPCHSEPLLYVIMNYHPCHSEPLPPVTLSKAKSLTVRWEDFSSLTP